MRVPWPVLLLAALPACAPTAAPPMAPPPPSPLEPVATVAPAPPPPAAPLGTEDLLLALGALNSPLEVSMSMDGRATAAEHGLLVTAKLIAAARPEDRALLEQSLDVQRALARYELGSPLDPALFDRLVAIDRAFAALYPDEPWPKLWLGRTLRATPAYILMFGPEGADRRERDHTEGGEILRALAERYPDNVHVQAERADVCASERGDPLECMRRYQRCLALAPKMLRCVEMLDDLRARYVAPYCATADVRRGFQVRIASAGTGRAVHEPVALAKLLIGPPVLRAPQVEEIAGSPPGGGGMVRVRVSAPARHDVKGARAALEGKRELLFVLMVGGQRIGWARDGDVQSDGSSIYWRKEATLDRVCARTSRRALPPELAP
jgi:hypothetical protein